MRVKIDRATARTCVGRLANMPRYPKDSPEALTVLIEAFLRIPDSPQHALQVADSLAASLEWCPTEHEIRKACLATSEVERTPQGCSECDFTGWRERRKRVKIRQQWTTVPYVEACGCRETTEVTTT